MRDIMPNPDCEKCSGDGGWYWDSPGESNDRVREWMSCDCWIECREEAPEPEPVKPVLRLIRGGKA